MSKHSAGPWEVFNNSIAVGVTHKSGGDVAWCQNKEAGMYNSQRDLDEVLANAELIAQAPGMQDEIKRLRIALLKIVGLSMRTSVDMAWRLDEIYEIANDARGTDSTAQQKACEHKS